MKFKNASAVENVVWQMLLADYPRAKNRALINDLANGVPPYTDAEQEENHISTNVNFLEMTNILHDARRQFTNAFVVPDPIFTVGLDYGPAYKKREWGSIITKNINKIIKGCPNYMETVRSTFANVSAHGIAPSIWSNTETWCPEAMGVEDVLLPSTTRLSMNNLPFFAVYQQYTGAQLMQMTTGPQVDPGWNLPLVEKSIAYVDEQARSLNATNWPEVWFPEKMSERMKEDGGLYASDATPTIDCFDFYFWDDSDGVAGWHRRIILDAWGQPGTGAIEKPSAERKFKHGQGDFLYCAPAKYADSLRNIIHWQFADLSAKAPFRYHAVRSLGFLLYSVCHLQNRLRCKFNDAVFESLLQYFRVANPADMDRLQKIDLIDKGLIPEGLQFVKRDERWQTDGALVGQAMQDNRSIMANGSTSFGENEPQGARQSATSTMVQTQNTAAMVGAMLGLAYEYQKFQYHEICRRFCLKNSIDPEVVRFRTLCLKHGVPEDALRVESWDIQPIKVIGQGNKSMQIAIADKLMSVRPTLDPDAQREVDRNFIAANADDYDLAQRLVPNEPHVTDSIHDSELAFGTLMQGVPVTPKPGLNAREVVETILRLLAVKVQHLMQTGGVGTQSDVIGLTLAEQYAGAFIQMLAQDKSEKARVKAYGDTLGKLMNEVKAMAQRQQQAAQQSQQQGQDMDPKDKAKIAAITITAKAKAQLSAQSHAQRTAQRQLQWEMEQQRKERGHKLDTMRGLREHQATLAKTGIEAAHGLALQKLQSQVNGAEE